MQKYSPLSLFKRKAKVLAKAQNLKLSAALDVLAEQSGFNHWHAVQAVAKASPSDPRLLKAVFGIQDLSEAVYGSVHSDIDLLLEDQLSGEIADTNASMFTIDELVTHHVNYDHGTGILAVQANVSYAGEQDPDRVYHATAFYFEALIRLYWNGARWILANDDPIAIRNLESDQDRDWRQQKEAGLL